MLSTQQFADKLVHATRLFDCSLGTSQLDFFSEGSPLFPDRDSFPQLLRTSRHPDVAPKLPS